MIENAEPLFFYLLGVVTGGVVTVSLLRTRLQHSPDMVKLAVDNATQASFIRAASDVLDDETNHRLKERANEVLEEYDIPGDPEWNLDGGEA